MKVFRGEKREAAFFRVFQRLTSDQMKARDRLLLFIALDGAPSGLDPVRLQKGMFLFAKDPTSTAAERYEFVPYNYGPMSTRIYADLDDLVAKGLVESVPVQGQSWCRYVPTQEGLEKGRELLREDTSPTAARRLHSIKREIAAKTFSQVLEDVYDQYPDFAAKSVFRRRS